MIMILINTLPVRISEWMNGNDEMMLQTSGSTGTPKPITVKKDWMKKIVA